MQTSKIKLAPKDAARFIKHSIQAGLVPFLKGSPGIGKSDVARQVAKDLNLHLIDVRLAQCDPTDLNGFPHYNEKTGRSEYRPMTTWPIVGDELPIKYDDNGNPIVTGKDAEGKDIYERYAGWFIFFDELPAAAPSIQAAAYKILLDRAVGLHKLHPAVKMAAAGNLSTDNAVAEDMSTALQSRLIHATMEVTLPLWTEWAYDNHIDPRIISFMAWKPQMLYTFQPDHTDDTFACPRTWAFASKQLDQGLDLKADALFARAVLTGTISEGPAREFIAFCNFFNKLPSMAEIEANPDGVMVPEEVGVQYALTGALAQGLASGQYKAESLFKYLGRLPLEYQVITLRSAIPRNRDLARIPEIMQWCQKNASSMF